MMTPRGGNFHVESSACLLSRGTARFVVLNSFCEDWGVVNGAKFIKLLNLNPDFHENFSKIIVM